MTRDKQLRGIKFKEVLSKSRRDQALNAKEFAVLAGISYSTAREWFQLPGFPRIQGAVFWQDFVQWRKIQNEPKRAARNQLPTSAQRTPALECQTHLPLRAVQILGDMK